MVNRLRLNEKSVRDAEPVKGRDYQIFDTDVRGFAVCIYRSGSRAFTIDYRHAGRQRRMTIGRWPEWSTTAARERAKELRREIDAGADPLGQKETGRDAPRVKDMIARYGFGTLLLAQRTEHLYLPTLLLTVWPFHPMVLNCSPQRVATEPISGIWQMAHKPKRPIFPDAFLEMWAIVFLEIPSS